MQMKKQYLKNINRQIINKEIQSKLNIIQINSNNC